MKKVLLISSLFPPVGGVGVQRNLKYIKYLPKYISIELENSFAEQLKVKEYLDKIIKSN